MERKPQSIPAKGLVPGSEEAPELYDGVVITGIITDEKGRKRFELAPEDSPDNTWTTLPINEGEEKRYKEKQKESKS